MIATILAITILNSNGNVQYQTPASHYEPVFQFERIYTDTFENHMQVQQEIYQKDSDLFHDRMFEQHLLTELQRMNGW